MSGMGMRYYDMNLTYSGQFVPNWSGNLAKFGLHILVWEGVCMRVHVCVCGGISSGCC